jgi:SPP1 gp7 family putative phage head morphogenesis protein
LPEPDIQIEDIEKQIDHLITKINASQADTLTKLIAAAYVGGSRAVTSTVYSKDKKRISDLQEQAIKRLTAEHFGYLTEFNAAVGEQIAGKARDILREGGGYKEISDYTKRVLAGKEQIIINNVGKTRKIIEIGKDGTLREVEKKITRPYVTTVDNYADMLGRTATHSAFEEGRAIGYQKLGFSKWRYVGPIDDRTRPEHAALVGQVFEYGTDQSNLALQTLHDPNCRHRAVAYFDDPELDAPTELFEEQKRKVGLRWDEEKGAWDIGEHS